MKQPEYTEGPKARENFEQGMKALFKIPKDEVVTSREELKEEACFSRSFLRESCLAVRGATCGHCACS